MTRPHDDHATFARICVVDDDAAVRHALCNLLEAGGYDVLAFESGEDLLDGQDLARIDVAVFDVKLRGMSGFTLLERVRERTRAEALDIPVLLISGHSDRAMEQRALDAGALELLRKPVDPDYLFERIEDALALRNAAR
jgi:two-component system response regulator FixJ